MPNPFKTPMQMMYENAHLPHYGGGGKTDVISQFGSRIQNAIRQYTKAAGKPPTAQEVKQLEDHIRSLTQPSPQAPMTPARAAAQEPFANKLVDQSGRPYGTMTGPSGKPVTPERALAPEMRDQFGSTPSNYSVRQATMEPPHVNAFPEDDFMSMANTGRASSRTWNKSYTPSAEELAQRQHMAEDVGMQMDDGADLGGLAQARMSEGDIPQMTSASAPFAERSGALEAGALNQLSGDILQGKHAKTIEAVIADFRARGIEPDNEDILNAINAQINPMRHNYTGENPIGQRPSLPSGARSTPEMEQWRDQMRMSGQPETTVATHPSDWNAAPKRDYLLDTTAETRQPFAKDWNMQELEDKRRRMPKKAEGGMMMMSPRDMQAQMMVQGYANKGQVERSDFFNPSARKELSVAEKINQEFRNPNYGGDPLEKAFWQNLPELKDRAYGAIAPSPEPSVLERISNTGEKFLRKHGVPYNVADKIGSTLVKGGPRSALPANQSALSVASFINPYAAAMYLPDAASSIGEQIASKNYGTAAFESAMAIPQAYQMSKLGSAAGRAARQVPTTPVGMNPEARLAEQVAGRPFRHMEGMTAPSDAARQEWIGRAHDVGANAFKTNDPAYKAAVFNAHREAGHPLITEHGAQNYDQMMKMAYENLGKETAAQARAIPNKMEFWGDADYAAKDYLARAKALGMKPAELMRQELAQNKPFQVYKDTLTKENPGHPYLANIDPVTGATQNELFRGVHDYFGHLGTKTPNTFGPKGEENAWLSHRQMYSPLAEPAATAETRGQNSYVNYVNPKNVELRKKGQPTTEFAQNLPVLLPPEASNPEYLGGLPKYLQGIVK